MTELSRDYTKKIVIESIEGLKANPSSHELYEKLRGNFFLNNVMLGYFLKNFGEYYSVIMFKTFHNIHANAGCDLEKNKCEAVE